MNWSLTLFEEKAPGARLLDSRASSAHALCRTRLRPPKPPDPAQHTSNGPVPPPAPPSRLADVDGAVASGGEGHGPGVAGARHLREKTGQTQDHWVAQWLN